MKPIKALCILILSAGAASAAYGQADAPASSSASKSTDQNAATAGITTGTADSPRADAYYDYTMGHIMEQEYESTSQPDFATQAIEFYKKAYALDPKSPVIGERLAEMYWESQRVDEAESEAQAILKADPSNVQTRRLLGHIYLRSLGDPGAASGQSSTVAKAVNQFSEVVRLDPTDTESALWLARLYRLQNDPDKAEKVLRGTLKDDPENEPALEQLTQLLLDEGKSSEAVGLLEGITAKAPTATLLDLLGDAYTQTKDYAKAEAAYRKAVDLDPSEVSHYRGLGQSLVSEEKYPEALKVYEKLIDLMPDDPDNYLRVAQIYRELNEYDKAEENLLKAKQYSPGSLEILYNEAMLYEAEGRFDDAIKVLSQAVTDVKEQSAEMPSRERSLAVLYQQLGQLYKDAQNYQAAENTYEELGRMGDEEDRRARLLLIDTYRASKDLPRAMQLAKESYAKYPSDPSIRTSYALLLGENMQTEEAVKLLRPLLNGTGADRDTYLNIAQIYEQGRQFKQAEEAVQGAEALPGNAQDRKMSWFLLGAIYERQKMYGKAEDEFKKVLAVDPGNAPALNYYGYMLGDLGQRLDEAQAMVQKALKEEPFNGAYLDSLGWIYYKQNKLPEAEATLQKAIARESHDPTILAHLGDIYAKMGRGDLAAAQWEKSLAEWKRVLPADVENDKIAETERKVNQSKHRVAQKVSNESAKPQ
ncbi:MAG TPA: tetratricopeptide repeat protein [Terriglobales bacterium]|nr:tetratricopeptide repeat protein [Terriglobales bacterium]